MPIAAGGWRRWSQFLLERFPPSSHLPMVALFAGFHAAESGVEVPDPRTLVAFCLSLAFFLKLRLYDELKDLDTDRVHHPERPLPRGLVSVRGVRRALAAVLLLETSIAFAWGGMTGIVFLPAVAWSLLMFKEFFLGGWLRRHLTTYAVTHTFVVVPLSMALQGLLSAREGVLPGLGDLRGFLPTALGCWLVFNVFEFARKTLATSEEREGIDTYSSVWGRTGAVALTATQAVGAALLASAGGRLAETVHAAAGLLALGGVGAFYLVRDTRGAAKVFRAAAGLWILWQLAQPFVIRLPGGILP